MFCNFSLKIVQEIMGQLCSINCWSIFICHCHGANSTGVSPEDLDPHPQTDLSDNFLLRLLGPNFNLIIFHLLSLLNVSICNLTCSIWLLYGSLTLLQQSLFNVYSILAVRSCSCQIFLLNLQTSFSNNFTFLLSDLKER